MKNFSLGLLIGIILNPFIAVIKNYIECLNLDSQLRIVKCNAQISRIQKLVEVQLDELYGDDETIDGEEDEEE